MKTVSLPLSTIQQKQEKTLRKTYTSQIIMFVCWSVNVVIHTSHYLRACGWARVRIHAASETSNGIRGVSLSIPRTEGVWIFVAFHTMSRLGGMANVNFSINMARTTSARHTLVLEHYFNMSRIILLTHLKKRKLKSTAKSVYQKRDYKC